LVCVFYFRPRNESVKPRRAASNPLFSKMGQKVLAYKAYQARGSAPAGELLTACLCFKKIDEIAIADIFGRS